MIKIAQKHYRVPLYAAIIFSICLLPVTARALPIDEVSATFNFGVDETVLLDVSVNADGSNFKYDYTLSNMGSDLTLLSVRVGYGLSGSAVPVFVVSSVVPAGNNTVRLVAPFYSAFFNADGAFGIDFDPLLGANDSISWSVVYDGFLDWQNVGVEGLIDGGLTSKKQTFNL
jgi:hypothetical protein